MDPTAELNFKDIFRKSATVSITVIIICFGYPLGLLVLVTLFIYRYAIQQIVKQLDPKFGNVLTGMNAAMSAHPPYIKPRSVLIPQYYLASSLDKNIFIKAFNEKIVELKSPNGTQVYAELRQKIVSKFGYNFWYNVDSFNIHDHIKYLDESYPERVVTQSELIEITGQLSKCPFEESRSPWEIFLIPNLQLEKDPTVKSVVVLRFHHLLLDGFTLSKIFERLGEKPWKSQKVINEERAKEMNFFNRKILPTLQLLIFGPYEILNAFYFSGEDNSWLQKLTEAPTGKISMQQTDIIQLSTLRTIISRSKGELTNASLLVTIFVQAVAKIMKKQGMIEGSLVKFEIGSPWPLPNHPVEDENSTGLTNHWTVVKFPVVVDLNDVLKTGLYVSREYKRLSKSALPHAFSALANLLGSLPVSWIEKADSGIVSTCLHSTFLGPFHAADICGVEVKEWVTGGSASSCAMSSLTMIYNGRFRYLISADESIANQEDVDELAVFCQQAVVELQHATKTNFQAHSQTRRKLSD